MVLGKRSYFGNPTPLYWYLEEPAWSLCHPSEAKDVSLASTAKPGSHSQIS